MLNFEGTKCIRIKHVIYFATEYKIHSILQIQFALPGVGSFNLSYMPQYPVYRKLNAFYFYFLRRKHFLLRCVKSYDNKYKQLGPYLLLIYGYNKVRKRGG